MEFGNALTLPFAQGLLYVEPIYVRGSSGYPVQRAVVVEFGKQLAWGKTLADALQGLFGASSSAPDPSANPAQPAGSPLQQAIAEAQRAYADGQKALRAGNLADYAKAQDRLKQALDKAAKAGGVAASPAR